MNELLGAVHAGGDPEYEDFWVEFFRPLRTRGLCGVRLVIGDHHDGLKNASARFFVGAEWQCCRLHFMRDILAKTALGIVCCVFVKLTRAQQPSTVAANSALDGL
jgi:putative transposase